MITPEINKSTNTSSHRPSPSFAQKLLSGAAWSFLAKIIAVISGLLVSASLARLLPPGEMGAYFLLHSTVIAGTLIARVGVKQTVVKFVAQAMTDNKPGRVRAVFFRTMGIVTVGATLVAGAYYSFVGKWLAENVYANPSLSLVIGLSAIWIVLLALQTPIAETFRGLKHVFTAAFLDSTFGNLLLAVALFTLLVMRVDISFVQSVQLATATAGISLLCGFYMSSRTLKTLSGDGAVTTREIFRISRHVYVIDLATFAVAESSLWIVAALFSSSDIALYGAAWKLVTLMMFPVVLLAMFMQPIIVELFAENNLPRLQEAVKGTSTLASLPCLLIFLIFLGFGSDILSLVYGEFYREAATILAILGFGQLVNAWTGLCGQVLIYSGHERTHMRIVVATGILSVALAIIGAMRYDVIGVAMAVSLGRIIQNGAAWFAVRRLHGVSTNATLDPRFILMAAKRGLNR